MVGFRSLTTLKPIEKQDMETILYYSYDLSKRSSLDGSIIIGRDGGITFSFNYITLCPESTMGKREKIARNQPLPKWMKEALKQNKAIVIKNVEILKDRGVYAKVIGTVCDVKITREAINSSCNFEFRSDGVLYKVYTPTFREYHKVNGEVVYTETVTEKEVSVPLLDKTKEYYSKCYQKTKIEDEPVVSFFHNVDFVIEDNKIVGLTYKAYKGTQRRFYTLEGTNENTHNGYTRIRNIFDPSGVSYCLINSDAHKGTINFFTKEEIGSSVKCPITESSSDYTSELLSEGLASNFKITNICEDEYMTYNGHSSNDGYRKDYDCGVNYEYSFEYEIDGVKYNSKQMLSTLYEY